MNNKTDPCKIYKLRMIDCGEDIYLSLGRISVSFCKDFIDDYNKCIESTKTTETTKTTKTTK